MAVLENNPKIWFVSKGTWHEGPFPEKEIIDSINSGDISESTLLWREGLASWQRVDELPEFSFLFCPPPPPPPPLMPKVTPPPILEDQDAPPPLPLKSPLPPGMPAIPSATAPDEISDELEEDVSEEDVEKQKKYNHWFNSFAQAIFILIILAIIFYAALSYVLNLKPARVPFMSETDHAHLVKMITSDVTKGSSADFVFNKQKTIFWVGANTAMDYEVTLRLNSIKQKILSKDEVIATGRALYKNGIAEFKNLRFEKGMSLPLGYYQYEVKSVRPIRNLKYKLLSFSPFHSIAYKKPLNFKGQIFWHDDPHSPNAKSDFAAQLKTFHLNDIYKKLEIYKDLEQKYHTLDSMLVNIESTLNKQLAQMKRGSDVKSFEAMYAKNYGTLLSTMAAAGLNEQGQMLDWEDVQKHYETIREDLKSCGLLIMNVITSIKGYKQIAPAVRPKIMASNSEAFKKLKDQLAKRLSDLQTTEQQLQEQIRSFPEN